MNHSVRPRMRANSSQGEKACGPASAHRSVHHTAAQRQAAQCAAEEGGTALAAAAWSWCSPGAVLVLQCWACVRDTRMHAQRSLTHPQPEAAARKLACQRCRPAVPGIVVVAAVAAKGTHAAAQHRIFVRGAV